MQRSWAKTIAFVHPASGVAISLSDTAGAVSFLQNHWRWGEPPEYFAAARACYLVLDEGADPEIAYRAVIAALGAVGIDPRPSV